MGAAYDLSRGPCRLRAFADNYQLWLCDGDDDLPFDEMPDFRSSTVELGYVTTSSAIVILTRAHRHSHRMELRVASAWAPDAGAYSSFSLPLETPSKTLALFQGAEATLFKIPGEAFLVNVDRFNLGEEGEDAAGLSDEEFFAHDEWERYVITLVPA